uniref:L-type lectin-like domain-containing protein n=1 Tax=Sexangularia sp. CB-2014 TaxID=1486929 RepID=A0A7S1V6Y2_9EUKA
MSRVVTLLSLFSLAFTQDGTFQYQNSFKNPFFLVRGTELPYWSYGGSTVISEDTVRLTPAANGKAGWMWNSRNFGWRDFSVEVEFRIGGGGRQGAEGLALWFVDPDAIDPDDSSTFGSSDRWVGLGIFIDTFDNDNGRDNPAVFAVSNDGTIPFDHDGDGSNMAVHGKCQANLRNPYRNNKLRVDYSQGLLTVSYDALFTGTYTNCFGPVPVTLPDQMRLGLSAKTGHLYDSHEIYNYVVTTVGEATADGAASGSEDRAGGRKQRDRPREPPRDRVVREADYGDAEPVDEDGAGAAQRLREAAQRKRAADEAARQVTIDNANNNVGGGADVGGGAVSGSADLELTVARLDQKVSDLAVTMLSMKQSLERDLVAIRTAMRGGAAGGGGGAPVDGAKLDSVAQEVGSLRNVLTNLEGQLNSKIGSQDIPTQIRAIVDKLATVQNVVHSTAKQANAKTADLVDATAAVREEVKSTSSFSYWTFFLLFQAFFFVVFVVWSRQKKEAEKKSF